MFKQYLHVEKFGNEEVEGIELGQVYVFPKIDGTNASIWSDSIEVLGIPQGMHIRAGSRTREISLGNDNQGFMVYLNDAIGSEKYYRFFAKNPTLRLYGEWLVPHTFKGYRDDCWRKFYVFDVYNDETESYLSYKVYFALLEEFGITYIPPLAIIKNGDYETFLKYVANNFFLCPDGGAPGEGICIKNYDYLNKYGRQAVAKIIRQEFKDEHNRVMGAPNVNAGLMNEERLLDVIGLNHMVDKTLAKITNEKGWNSKQIPELFNRTFHDVVKEELWDGLKQINYGTINFKTLKALIINRVKQQHPELF